ncbi:hypothetical protein [Leptodesmis sp.]
MIVLPSQLHEFTLGESASTNYSIVKTFRQNISTKYRLGAIAVHPPQ